MTFRQLHEAIRQLIAEHPDHESLDRQVVVRLGVTDEDGDDDLHVGGLRSAIVDAGCTEEFALVLDADQEDLSRSPAEDGAISQEALDGILARAISSPFTPEPVFGAISQEALDGILARAISSPSTPGGLSRRTRATRWSLSWPTVRTGTAPTMPPLGTRRMLPRSTCPRISIPRRISSESAARRVANVGN